MSGEGRLFKRSRWYSVAYYGPKDGEWKEIREAVRPRTDDEEIAREFLHRRRRSAENSRDGIEQFRGPAQEKVTVKDLLDDAKADYQLRQIKSLRQTIGHMKPIRDYFDSMRALKGARAKNRAYIPIRHNERHTN